MALLLDIPNGEEVLAQSAGAVWEPTILRWVAPTPEMYNRVSRWLACDSIVLGDIYLIEQVIECPRCHSQTPIYTFCFAQLMDVEDNEVYNQKFYRPTEIPKVPEALEFQLREMFCLSFDISTLDDFDESCVYLSFCKQCSAQFYPSLGKFENSPVTMAYRISLPYDLPIMSLIGDWWLPCNKYKSIQFQLPWA